MIQLSETLKKFINDHKIVVRSLKPHRTYSISNPFNLRYEIDADPFTSHVKSFDETMLTIEVTASQFETISFMCNNWAHYEKDAYYDRTPTKYNRDLNNELYLRRNNAAVKKAYEQYQMMLKIATDGDLPPS